MAGFSTAHVLLPGDSKSVNIKQSRKYAGFLCVYRVSICIRWNICCMEQPHYLPSQLADTQQILSGVHERTVLYTYPHFHIPSVRLLKTISKYESTHWFRRLSWTNNPSPFQHNNTAPAIIRVLWLQTQRESVIVKSDPIQNQCKEVQRELKFIHMRIWCISKCAHTHVYIYIYMYVCVNRNDANYSDVYRTLHYCCTQHKAHQNATYAEEIWRCMIIHALVMESGFYSHCKYGVYMKSMF